MFRRRSVLTLRREDGRIVCERVVVMDRWFSRMHGLLGRRSVGSDEGVVIRPGFSIHTAFMRFPIDVVFLDSDLMVLKIDEAVRPFRTAACRGAREVVELREGEAARRGLVPGDRVTWAPVVEDADLPELDIRPNERRAVALVGSRDPRFAKLLRVLLDKRGVAVEEVVPADRLVEELFDTEVDIVVLDIGDRMAEGLRIAGAVNAAHADVTLLVAGEDLAGQPPDSLRVFHKWDETEAMMSVVDDLVGDGGSATVEGPV